MTTTSFPAVEHGITITEVSTPTGTPRRADCFCGWQSKIVVSNPQALAAGEAHIAAMGDYPSRVADRIAQEACRGPLTVDQLGEIAGTLGCTASSLLPSHAVSSDPATHGMAKRYAATNAQGKIYERFVANGAPDPNVVDCPAWCDQASEGHRMEMADSDRSHWGQIFSIPVRSINAEVIEDGEERGYLLGVATLWLKEGVLEREPTIWLGEGETRNGLTLSLSEAEDIAAVLTQLVRTAEAAR